jgi:hypothetical protein
MVQVLYPQAQHIAGIVWKLRVKIEVLTRRVIVELAKVDQPRTRIHILQEQRFSPTGVAPTRSPIDNVMAAIPQ